jgi:hypothetical protein
LPENLVISFHFQKSTFLDIFSLMQLACPAAFAIDLLPIGHLLRGVECLMEKLSISAIKAELKTIISADDHRLAEFLYVYPDEILPNDDHLLK